MAIVTVGIDLAKNVFAIHGVDQDGKAVLVQTEGLTRSAGANDCAVVALPDRHGSLLRRALLGTAVSPNLHSIFSSDN